MVWNDVSSIQCLQNISHVVTELENVPERALFIIPKVYYMSEIFSAVEIVTWTKYGGKWRALECYVYIPCLTIFRLYPTPLWDKVPIGIEWMWNEWKMKTDRKLVGGKKERIVCSIQKKWVVYDYNHHHQHLYHPMPPQEGTTMMKLTLSLFLLRWYFWQKGGTSRECTMCMK